MVTESADEEKQWLKDKLFYSGSVSSTDSYSLKSPKCLGRTLVKELRDR